MYLSVRTGRGHLLGDQDLAVTDISVFLPQIYHILALFHLWLDGTLGKESPPVNLRRQILHFI